MALLGMNKFEIISAVARVDTPSSLRQNHTAGQLQGMYAFIHYWVAGLLPCFVFSILWENAARNMGAPCFSYLMYSSRKTKTAGSWVTDLSFFWKHNFWLQLQCFLFPPTTHESFHFFICHLTLGTLAGSHPNGSNAIYPNGFPFIP